MVLLLNYYNYELNLISTLPVRSFYQMKLKQMKEFVCLTAVIPLMLIFPKTLP